MRILFITADIFIGEPLGVLQLSAILKASGHETRLIGLRTHNLWRSLKNYTPDIVAYSVMSSEAHYFTQADVVVREYIQRTGRRVGRIMGGPHPTFFPETVNELGLDAVCIGEGDNALPEFVKRFSAGQTPDGVCNLLTSGADLTRMPKELIMDLDALPYPDKSIYYEAMPMYRNLTMRAVMASRGCPYNCTYCFNHAYRTMFRGCGPMVRRRSVESVISEIKYLMRAYPPVRFMKFNDDTFAHKVDDWLLEFAERYRREINLPFYCLMRSNAMTDEMAKILKESGCRSISMSVESGNEVIRNEVLKRGLTDEKVIDSFASAHRYGIKTYGNTLLAIPGTTLEDDYNSFFFTKKLRMTLPTFCIFNPFQKLELTEEAVKRGLLDKKLVGSIQVGELTPLNCYTDGEKYQQLALSFLGPLMCDLPDSFNWMVKGICRKRFLLPVYRLVGNGYMILKAGLYIFPSIYPRNITALFRLFWQSLYFFKPARKMVIEVGSD